MKKKVSERGKSLLLQGDHEDEREFPVDRCKHQRSSSEFLAQNQGFEKRNMYLSSKALNVKHRGKEESTLREFGENLFDEIVTK